MMYTDYEFYYNTYFGDIVPESDFPWLCARACDYLDSITFDRLANGLPTNEHSAQKIKKAVCAMVDALYQLEQAKRNAIAAAAAAASASGTSATSASRTVVSESSGGESISYASASDLASGAKNWSKLYEAAGDEQKTNALLYAIAQPYLRRVCNDEGICLLFAGV